MIKGWGIQKNAFTIVELLIAIAVIGILVAIAIIGYSNVRQAGAVRAMQSDLLNAYESIESDAALTGGLEYPDEAHFLDGIRLSAGVTLTPHVSNLPHYSNMTPVQNGVLVSEICQDLVEEGYGSGLNAGGNTDNYITGCGNWNDDRMQVTGWSTQQFSVPVSATAFTDYADSVPAADSYHPNQRSTIQNFYRQMNSRFVDMGGTYPINSFWDYWANSGNGGVMYQNLPTPDSTAVGGVIYCIDGSHTNTTIIWHVRQNGKLTEGPC